MELNKNIKEIDITSLLGDVWKGKKILIRFLLFFTILGIVVALCTPKTYTSEVILAPEMNTGGFGLSESLSSMASTFGIEIGNKSAMDAIYPEIYPTVLITNDFIIPLLDIKVYLKKDSTKRSYFDHILKDTKPSFWGYPMSVMKSLLPQEEVFNEKGIGRIDPCHLSSKQESIIGSIRKGISCIIDSKTRIITIGVKDQDPQVAAIIADSIQKRLQQYIIAYRTKKANNDLIYYKKLLLESFTEYQSAQKKYTRFCDANMKIALTSVEAKRNELENEMQTKFNIYNQVNTQVQQAKAKVQEQTPAFTIIQKAAVPNRASSTPRSLIVIIYILVGGIIGVGWILLGKEITNLVKLFRK